MWILVAVLSVALVLAVAYAYFGHVGAVARGWRTTSYEVLLLLDDNFRESEKNAYGAFLDSIDSVDPTNLAHNRILDSATRMRSPPVDGGVS